VATSWITTAKKQRRHNPEKKIMATIFWDCQGILLVDFKDRNTTVTGEYYASLIYKLKDAIKEKGRGKLSQGMRLLHDNAPAYTSVAVKAAIQCCGFQDLNHPPDGPDLAPTDYFCFQN
jgi:hypothetical protein